MMLVEEDVGREALNVSFEVFGLVLMYLGERNLGCESSSLLKRAVYPEASDVLG